MRLAMLVIHSDKVMKDNDTSQIKIQIPVIDFNVWSYFSITALRLKHVRKGRIYQGEAGKDKRVDEDAL
jgi:hypothetical protein